MRVVSPGVFEVVLAGGPREIKLSLGLKGELYKLLVRKQLAYQQLSMKCLIDEDDKRRIAALADEIGIVASGDDKEQLERLRKQLDASYVQAFEHLELRQKEFMHELALGKVQLTDDSVVESLAMLLSEYEMGKVTKEVTAEELRWADEYLSVQEELMEFLDVVIEYLDATLKKTPQFNKMLENLVEPPQRKTT